MSECRIARWDDVFICKSGPIKNSNADQENIPG